MRNYYKRAVCEDKFFRKYVCVKFNHPKVWAWLKRDNSRAFRRLTKKENYDIIVIE